VTDETRKSDIQKALSFGEGWVRPSSVNEEKQPGIYEVNFGNVGTSRDLSLPSGIYFYQIKAGNFIFIKKMVLLK
jgi:hypothetical protein